MDLDPYAERLRREFTTTAQVAGEEARAVAGRLAVPLDAAARLIFLELLSAAAAEITGALAPGSVEVRMRGRNPEFAVTPPPAGQSPGGRPVGFKEALAKAVEVSFGVRTPAFPVPDDASPSRITLRLPEQLKTRAEEAAGRDGLSLNSWLVRVVSAAVELSEGA
jgi:hypothetical protein